jgi:hypothetical protein
MKVRTILYFLILVCTSCSSQILVPSWFDHKTEAKKHNWLDYEGIIVIAENLDVTDRHFVFDVEIKNETDYRIRFNPETIYYMGSNAPYPSESQEEVRLDFETKLKKYHALSEEEVVRHLEQRIKREKRTHLITGILSAGLIAFDAAMSAEAMNSEVTSKLISQEAIRSAFTFGGLAAMDVVRGQSAMTAAAAREDLYFLPEELLEESVILPGETYRGKVFFPACHDRFIRMLVPVETNDFALDFRWADNRELRKLRRVH